MHDTEVIDPCAFVFSRLLLERRPIRLKGWTGETNKPIKARDGEARNASLLMEAGRVPAFACPPHVYTSV